MANSSVGVGGAWKELVNGTAVGVGGVWKNIEKAWVGVGGAWKEWFVAAIYALPSGSLQDIGFLSGSNQASIFVNFFSNGTFTVTAFNAGTLASGNWVTPTALAPGSYTIRAHLNSGDTPSGSLDTDLALSSNRAWGLTQIGPGVLACQLLLTLKDGGGATVASGTIDINADVEPF